LAVDDTGAKMESADWALLASSDVPRHDPEQATIVVLVQVAAESSVL